MSSDNLPPSQDVSSPPAKKMTKAERAQQLQDMTLKYYNILKGNPLVFFHRYFPHHIRVDTPKFHVDMIRGAVNNRFLAVAAPRESAKSTILVFVKPFHDIMFKKRRFVLIIGNTFKKAAMSLDTIKKELMENRDMTSEFIGVTIEKDAEGDSEIRHPDGFVTKVLCRGVDQIGSVRGVKFGAYRPDLIIGDDMEDDELVKNPVRRSELQQLFNEALIPAGDRGICQYIVVGTILHDDSLLAKLVGDKEYPEWKKLFFRARNENPTTHELYSLWPEKWTLEDLNKMEKDNPSVFAKEYQNDPVAGRNAKFRREDFRYWRQEHGDYILLDQHGDYVGRGRLLDCVPAISCDLAWKEKRESDSCVILPGYLTPTADILVEDYICEKGLRPDDIANHLFVMVARMKALTNQVAPVGFEKAMLENVTKWFLKQEMRKRNQFLVTKELLWDSDKITRIESRLVPRYSQHVIYHKRGMGDLEHQLERHPYGTHDDLVDALQGLVQLLQFPKLRAVEPKPDDAFNWWRAQILKSKNKSYAPYSGKGKGYYEIPSVESFR